MMAVCYFGSYDQNYSRNRIIIKGLERNNVRVIECRDFSVFWLRCIKLFLNYVSAESHDAVIVGAQGHANVPLAWLLSRIFRRRILFDPFISLYDTAILDRKEVSEKSLESKYYYLLDEFSCKLAEVIITDTKQHAKYFSEEFNIPRRKIRVVYIGADDDIFYPRNIKFKDRDKFIVEFHGSFIPLQGIQYIIHAAKLLETEENVFFEIIGKGQTYKEMLRLAKRLEVRNVSFIGWVNYTEVPNYIARADLCLGIFGDTIKAKRVIPNKAFEILAMKKPLITGDSPAAREVLTNNRNAVLCEMANPEDLADKVLLLRDNIDLRNKIAEKGYRLYKDHFTPVKIGELVKNIVDEICSA